MKKIWFVILIVLLVLLLIIKYMFFSGAPSSMKLNDEVFPTYYDEEYKQISKTTGKDEQGNAYSLIEFSPEEFDANMALDYIQVLLEDEGFFEMDDSSLEDEMHLAKKADEDGKMLVVAIHCDEESSYIKYMIKDSVFDEEYYEEEDYQEDLDEEIDEIEVSGEVLEENI